MDWLHAVVLGLLQGITEFLPISSSAHLILFPRFVDWPDQGLAFDIAVNTGTLLAVMLYFHRQVRDMAGGLLRAAATRSLAENPAGHLAFMVALATIPVGVCGLLFHEQVATLGRNPTLIAATSILFGLLLWWADRGLAAVERTLVDPRMAVLIGLAQAVALIPGVSRSGITITAALFLGFSRKTSAEFSFLMAIPVGLLAGGLDLVQLLHAHVPAEAWISMGIGFLASAISAFLVIHWLLSWIRQRKLTIFVVYRILLGLVILAV